MQDTSDGRSAARNGSGTSAVLTWAAGASAGAALWCSVGVLDRVVTPSGTARVAMLPPWWALAVLMAAAAALAAAARWRGLVARDGTLPLFGSLLLVLPYLPVLPDAVPALQVLAGPARWLVWAIVGSGLWQALSGRARAGSREPHPRPSPFPRDPASQVDELGQRPALQASGSGGGQGRLRGASGAIASFAGGVVVLGAVAAHVTGTPYFPGGDEPHYLVIMQSLVRDGDLKIENNHARLDYAEYFGRDLKPHYLTRGVDREIYSIHPIGMPLLAAPAYAVAGYPGVLALMVVLAAAAGALLWHWARDLTASDRAAWFAWAAAALSAPFVLNAVSVYPEIPAALAVMIALAWQRAGRMPDLLRSVAVAALPWLSTKYAPMAVALVAVLLWRIRRDNRTADFSRLALFVIAPCVISLAAWLAFFQVYWGSPLPSAPYGGYSQTRIPHIRVGGPGVLFDQEYGIVPYAPLLLIGMIGLVSMAARTGPTRRVAIELAVVGAALVATVGAFRIWWGGTSAPGRPVASGLLLLGVPIAIHYAGAAGNAARRAAHHALLTVGLGVTAMLVLVGQGALSNNRRDGSSTLLEWVSPTWLAAAAAPTYIGESHLTAHAVVACWTGAALLAGVVLARLGGRLPLGRAHLLAVAVMTTATLAAAAASEALSRRPLKAPLEGRSRVTLLDRFDAGRRPVAIVYDPLRFVPPGAVPPLVTLTAAATIARPKPPLPVLFDGRFALPAGEYEVALTTTAAVREDGVLGLMVGSSDPFLETWSVATTEPGIWRGRFALAMDVGFVGFRASQALATALTALRVTPVRILDLSARPAPADVTSAARYAAAVVYFHDQAAWPEPTGFWTRGRTTSRFTIAPRSAVRGVRVRAGPGSNGVTIDIDGRETTFTLAAGEARETFLEARAGADDPRQPVRVAITSVSGFRPSEVTPGSLDSRTLGVWVELVPDDGR